MLRLGKLLGEGASGKVYAIQGQAGTAAKLYHSPEEARRYDAKIEAMLAKPPELMPGSHGGGLYPQIAWPTGRLHDRAGSFIGFLMPEIDFARSTSLVNLLQKNSRKLEGISEYYGYRVLVARNLASVFSELHRSGHHMIDMKPANLRFYPAVSWMAVVDADGFSIAGANGRIGALQLSDEYIAPESWNRKPGELGLEQDLFALAAIIFQLLNNGVHPFAGTVSGSAATDLQTRIVQGHYPYAISPRRGMTPSTASIHRMFRRSTRAMFDAAFLTVQRPSAMEWRDHLDELVAQLTSCAERPGEHVHFGGGCGFCGHEARIDAVRVQTRRVVRPRVQARPRPYQPPRPKFVMPPRPVAPHPTYALVLQRKRKSLALGGAVLAMLLGGVAIGSDQLWELMPRQAFAETAATPTTSFAGVLTPFAEPHEYFLLAEGGKPAATLHDGPGQQYAALSSVDPLEPLFGSATATADDGSVWAMVIGSDGVSGFVPKAMLINSESVLRTIACPSGRTCEDGAVAASERAVGIRYRELYARSAPVARAMLAARQDAWQAQRQACGGAEIPVACRLRVAAARWTQLDEYALGTTK